MKKLTPEQAKAQGYKPLTNAFSLPPEQWMVDQLFAQLKRANAEGVLVATRNGAEVWKR
jgi:hypothetical protein